MRAIIVIPYYSADREAAFRLARFITELEPRYREDVEMMLVPRGDAIPPSPVELLALARRLPASWWQTSGMLVGHPAGSNEMAREIFAESYRRRRNGEWADVVGLIFVEPDCVPVDRDWINKLMAEYMFGRQHANALVVGCFRDVGVDVPHINGNAVYDPDVAHRCDFAVTNGGLGWDSAMAEQFSQAWMKTSLIANLWNERNVPDERMEQNPFTPPGTPPPVLIHGVKDDSAWAFAKRKLGL